MQLALIEIQYICKMCNSMFGEQNMSVKFQQFDEYVYIVVALSNAHTSIEQCFI